MAAADYALCDSCTGKVFYDADTDIPAGTVILHPDCMVKELAKVRDEGYRKAIADARDGAAFMAWYRSSEGRRAMSDRTYSEITADFLESRLTEGPTDGT